MDIQERVLNAFQVEHKEQLEGIRSILTAFRQGGDAPDESRLNEAFRMAHTLKGGARICDLRDVESLGHRLESVFSHLQSGSLEFTSIVGETILVVLDAIEDWMAALASKRTPHPPTKAIDALNDLLKTVGSQSVSERQTHPPVDKSPVVHEELARISNEPASVRVGTEYLDCVMSTAESFMNSNGGHDQISLEIANLNRSLRTLTQECEFVRATSSSKLRRLTIDPEFTSIARHVEHLGQQVRRLSRHSRSIRALHEQLAWNSRVTTTEMHRGLLRLRMVAAESIFEGLRPMIRSLARDEERDVEFNVEGLAIQADRRVLQSIKDPIMHCLRNAVVHGIERPSEREKSGKSRIGKITLRLAARESALEIDVEDDGRGVDFARVVEVGKQRGLLRNPHAAETPETELVNLLFQPGFSTSTKINELVGRGMGLSVVHESISRLQGSVDVKSRIGIGTSIKMIVPLSLSAQRLLLVTCGDRSLGIPLRAIDRLISVKKSDLGTVEGRPVIHSGGSTTVLISLAQALGLKESAPFTKKENVLAIALNGAGRHTALVVDRFVAERDVVLKELAGPLIGMKHISGAWLLETGEIALVINPTVVATGLSMNNHADRVVNSNAQPSAIDKTILVVDDSFTTRTLEKSILEANGFDVRVAVNGIDAMRCLRSEPIGLVIADIEMPKMDGFTLLAEIKKDERLSHIPVILVTSRDEDRDQERGLALGASAYIIKRKFDHQNLLKEIRRVLG